MDPEIEARFLRLGATVSAIRFMVECQMAYWLAGAPEAKAEAIMEGFLSPWRPIEPNLKVSADVNRMINEHMLADLEDIGRFVMRRVEKIRAGLPPVLDLG